MFTCKRCGYTTKYKCNLKTHLTKKKVCKGVLEDIEVTQLLNELLGKTMTKPINDIDVNKMSTFSIDTADEIHKLSTFSIDTTDEIHKMSTFSIDTADEIHKPEYEHKKNDKSSKSCIVYSCDYCGREYKHRQSRSLHMKTCCKKTTSGDDLLEFFREQLDKKDKQIEEIRKLWASERTFLTNEVGHLLDKVGGDVTNIENQNNINIHINNYGNENLDYIDSDYIKNLLNIPFAAVPKLLKNIHFHPNHPENHNIKITNKKLPYASIYSGSKWILKDKKEVINNIVDKSYNILDEHYVEKKPILDIPKINNYEIFQKEYELDDKKLKRQLTKEVEMIILNEGKI